MRQLDLFGSVIDTAPAEKKTGEKQPVAKKEEDVASVSKIEATPLSLVELAEETLGANAFNRQDEMIKTGSSDSSHSNLTDQQEKEAILFSQNEMINEKPSEAINEEKLQTHPDWFDGVNEAEEQVSVDQIQKEANLQASQRNGAVIFDDGKIAVKVKSKPAMAAENIAEEKGKKEPQKRGRKPIKEIEAEADLIEVPDDEVLFQKQYYPISEVAKWFRVNTSLLRFWENEFEILKPRKNRKGDRLFRPEDVKSLQLIYQLLRQRKYTIEGAKDYIKTNRKKADIELQLTNTLQKFKSFLLDLKANMS